MVFYHVMDDRKLIKKCIQLAKKAEGFTSPNPMVGAIIVKEGKIISEAYHLRPGTPHAEALAIQKIGEKAKGSTLYVNLEPCCHKEKRTPPCTQEIIKAGISKVVIGMVDPNPKVSGKGILELKNAGIEIKTGVMEYECKKLNESYIKYIKTGEPFVILKIAMTLDGKIATPEGQSKWITSERSRRYVHKLRRYVDAILTAIGTVRADDPELTSRIRNSKNPLRIVIDPKLEIPLGAKILKMPPQTIIVTKAMNIECNEDKLKKKDRLRENGVEFLEYEENLDLKWLISELGKMEITSMLIEGGSSLSSHALEDDIVDKVLFFIAPKIIGGKESYPAVGGRSFRRLEDAYRVRNIKIRRIDDDILVEGYLHDFNQ